MLSYEAADLIIKKHPWLEKYRIDLGSCILNESSYWSHFVHKHGDLGDFSSAVNKACEVILEWINDADAYEVDVCNLEDLANFVAHYRTACVWVVLICRQHQLDRAK